MSTLIICPACKQEFEPEDAIAKSLEKQYEQKFNKDRESLLNNYAEKEKVFEEKKENLSKRKKKKTNYF